MSFLVEKAEAACLQFPHTNDNHLHLLDSQTPGHLNLCTRESNFSAKAQVFKIPGITVDNCGSVFSASACRQDFANVSIHAADAGNASKSSIAFENSLMHPSHDCIYGGLLASGEKPDNVLRTLCVLARQGFLIDHGVIIGLLQNCNGQLHMDEAWRALFLLISNGLDTSTLVVDHLVGIFASLGFSQQAFAIFHKIPERNVCSWHLFISGCISNKDVELVFKLFDQMQHDFVKPNDYIFSSILKFCGSIGALDYGRNIHHHVIRHELSSNLFVGTTLIDMYAKCNCLDEARQVFDELMVRNVICWNAMIGGYVKHGRGASAIDLYNEMQIEGIRPDRITLLCILQASSMVRMVEQGMRVHSEIVGGGFQLNLLVGTCLVDMYIKCGYLKVACSNFQKMRRHDVVSWGAIMAGYVESGDFVSCLQLFKNMQEEGVQPDIVTYSIAIKACGHLGALGQARLLHEQVSKNDWLDVIVISILIEMYSRCGSLIEAQKLLEEFPNSGISSWGAMITGYASHGDYKLASATFRCMQKHGFVPNDIIYTSILDACSHAGEVDAGCKYFKDMKEKHHIWPDIRHFGSMVDLLGRAGYVDEAEDMIELLPIVPDVKCWMSLLTSCQKFKAVSKGRSCFNHIIQLDPSTTGSFIMMKQIYADGQQWGDVKEIESLRTCLNAWKLPGKAWIEVDRVVHEFVVDERKHPMLGEIKQLWENMTKLMREEGYMPDRVEACNLSTQFQTRDSLFGHCERLAIGFGLLTLSEGESVRVTKNLRMCNDCHSVSKIVSKFKQRHIVVRDEYCVHHFKDGLCSCGDNN